jgi:hypothetical protein
MSNEYVDLNGYINNERVLLKTLKSLLHTKRLYPPIEIDMNDYDIDGLRLSKEGADISRTTQEYAKQFNEKIICEPFPKMKSHSDGYSFIGEAFINFVTALVVYDMFPNETSSTLVVLANMYRNNEYISNIATENRMTQYLTKMKKTQMPFEKLKRQSACAFKGLIGVLYAENGISKMIDILQYVNKCIVPNNQIDFTGKEAVDTLLQITIFVIGLSFGSLTTMLVMK